MPVIKTTATTGLLLKLKKNKSTKSKKKVLTKTEEQAELRKKSIKKLIKGKIKS